MMNKFILVIATLLVFSCKKNKLDLLAFSQCSSAQPLDSAATATKLVGSWKWTKQFCFWVGKTTKADKIVKVNFNADGSFNVIENGITITLGNWTLKVIDQMSWQLNTSTSSIYLYGGILFCGKEVLFNNSNVDGCDNLFEKTN